jgi:hypothetical protein
VEDVAGNANIKLMTYLGARDSLGKYEHLEDN